MAYTLANIRNEIANDLDTVTGLRVYDTIPDNPQLPAAVVTYGSPLVELNEAMNKGMVIIRFDVLLATAFVVNRASQDQMDGLLSAGTGHGGTTSVIDALEADRTLNGQVHDLQVESIGEPYVTTENNMRVLNTVIGVQCLADRT